MLVYLNGQFVEESQAKISIFDLSYLRGIGVFETLRDYEGHLAFAARHYQRLARNAKTMGIPLPFSETDWKNFLAALLGKNRATNVAVRVTVSPTEKGPTNVSAFCQPITLDPNLFQRGATVLTLENFLNDPAPQAGIKSTSYSTKMQARDKAKTANAYETLLQNNEGHWVEGSKTNLFIVKQGTVITPPLHEGLLPGITREVVLE